MYLEIPLDLSRTGGSQLFDPAVPDKGSSSPWSLSIHIHHKEPGDQRGQAACPVTEQVAKLKQKPRSLPPEPGGFFSLCGKYYDKDLFIVKKYDLL